MSSSRIAPSVGAWYKAHGAELTVTAGLYDKLKRVELPIARAWWSMQGGNWGSCLRQMPSRRPEAPGLSGTGAGRNHLAGDGASPVGVAPVSRGSAARPRLVC